MAGTKTSSKTYVPEEGEASPENETGDEKPDEGKFGVVDSRSGQRSQGGSEYGRRYSALAVDKY